MGHTMNVANAHPPYSPSCDRPSSATHAATEGVEITSYLRRSAAGEKRRLRSATPVAYQLDDEVDRQRFLNRALASHIRCDDRCWTSSSAVSAVPSAAYRGHRTDASRGAAFSSAATAGKRTRSTLCYDPRCAAARWKSHVERVGPEPPPSTRTPCELQRAALVRAIVEALVRARACRSLTAYLAASTACLRSGCCSTWSSRVLERKVLPSFGDADTDCEMRPDAGRFGARPRIFFGQTQNRRPRTDLEISGGAS